MSVQYAATLQPASCYPGTPTFVAVDRNGRVVATIPGYPMREVLKQWYAVMVGDQEVP